MTDDDMIRSFLTSAGMLMEDASATVILGTADPTKAIALLRDTARDLNTIATAVEAVQLRKRTST
jgi:hypothetical protein